MHNSDRDRLVLFLLLLKPQWILRLGCQCSFSLGSQTAKCTSTNFQMQIYHTDWVLYLKLNRNYNIAVHIFILWESQIRAKLNFESRTRIKRDFFYLDAKRAKLTSLTTNTPAISIWHSCRWPWFLTTDQRLLQQHRFHTSHLCREPGGRCRFIHIQGFMIYNKAASRPKIKKMAGEPISEGA